MAGRDLHIGLDADDRGFERAFNDAEESAKGLDRELGRLTRQQKLAEFATERNAAAVRRYGREQDKAALAAKKAGETAQRAATRADLAIRRAAEAADKLAHGEITEAQAARQAAQAEKAIERSAYAAAAAHRAAARAADEQADQERQLAREAALAAATEQLAQLRAAGSIRKHNALLRGLRDQFPEIGKSSDSAFREMERASLSVVRLMSRGASLAASAWENSSVLIRVGIAALPLAAAAAGAGISLGFGAAIGGVGLAAALQSKEVRTHFSALADFVTHDAQRIGLPMEGVLKHVAEVGAETWDELADDLGGAVDKMAPRFRSIVDQVGGMAKGAGPFIDQMTDKAGEMFDAFSGRLPDLIGHVADALRKMSNSADPQALDMLIDIIDGSVSAIAELVSLAEQAATGLAILWNSIKDGAGAIKDFAVATTVGDDRVAVFQAHLTGTAGDANILSDAIGKLTDNMEELAGKNLSVAQAQLRLDEAMKSAADHIKASGHALTDVNRLSTENREKLFALADAAGKTRKAFNDAGKDATTAMARARAAFINAAVKMGLTRGAAARLADSFGLVRQTAGHADTAVQTLARERKLRMNIAEWNRQIEAGKAKLRTVPPDKRAKLLANIRDLQNKVAAAKRALASLRDKTVTVRTNYVQTSAGPIRTGSGHFAKGGLVGYASGGRIESFPSGGMVRGLGTSTSDSTIAAVSRGEMVINARDTAIAYPLLKAINSGMLRNTPRMPARAAGGGGGGVMQLTISLGNQRVASLLIDPMRREIKNISGGDVQAALGTRR